MISFPFRYTTTGEVATVLPGSDQEVHELLAVLCLTTAGERIMEPEFGLSDPDWTGITESDVITGVEDFGPEGITIVEVVGEQSSGTRRVYQIEWAREAVEVDTV